METIVIYHQVKTGTDCPDGICAAWIAAKAHNFLVELVGETYKKDWKGYILPFDPTGKKIIFVDYAGYPDELMEEIALLASEVIVLDHHESRGKELIELSDSLPNLYSGYVPNELGCGSTIAWDYFFPTENRPWFLKYVRTRDTGIGGYWQGKLPRHEAVNEVISSMRKGLTGIDAFKVYDYLCSVDEHFFDVSSGKYRVELKNKLCWEEVDYWLKYPDYICLSDAYSDIYQGKEGLLSVPLLKIRNPIADRHCSWVGTYLSEVNPDAPFVVIITKENPNTIHLRKPVNSKFNCGQIAKLFGGGGHEAAAGFSI